MGSRKISNSPILALRECLLLASVLLLVSTLASTFSTNGNQDYLMRQQQQRYLDQRASFVARRAADDARPLSRVHLVASASQEEPIVVGKLKAPAPERIFRQRVPKQSNLSSQTVSASYRVSDSSELPEKVVHGVIGAGSSANQRQPVNQRTVSAKMLVSDEGLNYPPSKLSADIYGNVAEIVTAPPEAVENDFLVPQSSKFFGARRSN